MSRYCWHGNYYSHREGSRIIWKPCGGLFEAEEDGLWKSLLEWFWQMPDEYRPFDVQVYRWPEMERVALPGNPWLKWFFLG